MEAIIVQNQVIIVLIIQILESVKNTWKHKLNSEQR